MENWKVALVAGAAGVGTLMFLKKKWTAGIILAGVGVATLASEYPEQFAEVRQRLPDFIERGNNFLEVASRVETVWLKPPRTTPGHGTSRC